jgi:inhibitor of KinA sporulation pathway (predicted exonuclease)
MPHWLVIDLEATTDEGGWPITEMEIIEIGATLVDRRVGSWITSSASSNRHGVRY